MRSDSGGSGPGWSRSAIGHSFGGMIAQKLLGQDLAVAAVAIDAAQIKQPVPWLLSGVGFGTEPGRQRQHGYSRQHAAPPLHDQPA